MKKRMARQIPALILALVLTLGLSACGRSAARSMTLSEGWLVRADGLVEGEAKGWMNGFSQQEANGQTDADVVWYACEFRAALTGGSRRILTLADMDAGAKVWLNGKLLDYSGAWGVTRLDVTDAMKKSGKNTLVIRTEQGKAWSLDRTVISAAEGAAVLDVAVDADAATGRLAAQVTLSADALAEMTVTAIDTGRVMARTALASENGKVTLEAVVDGAIAWSGENPYLYLLEITADGDRYAAEIGFTDRGVNDKGELTDGGVPVYLKGVTVPDAVLGDAAAMRTFVNYIRTVGFNLIRSESGHPTQALLDYCGRTGVYVDAAVGVQPSAVDVKTLAVAKLPAVADGRGLPAEVSPEELRAWYDTYGLDRQFGNAVEAYEAVGVAYVKWADASLLKLRAEQAGAGFVYGGSVAPYPQTMMDTFYDAIADLRFCIEAADVAVTGSRLSFSVSIADYYVLWNREFPVTVTVNGPSGTIYEKKVTVDGQVGNRVIPVLTDSIVIGSEAGEYSIGVVVDNYAHPTCGTKTIAVYNRADLPAWVYASGLSEEATQTLRTLGVSVRPFAGSAKVGEIVMAGAPTQDVLAVAKAGATVIVVGADTAWDMPVDGTFKKMEYLLADGQAWAVDGLALEASGGRTVLPAVGFDGNTVVGAAAVSAFDWEQGRLVFCTNTDPICMMAAWKAE